MQLNFFLGGLYGLTSKLTILLLFIVSQHFPYQLHQHVTVYQLQYNTFSPHRCWFKDTGGDDHHFYSSSPLCYTSFQVVLRLIAELCLELMTVGQNMYI